MCSAAVIGCVIGERTTGHAGGSRLPHTQPTAGADSRSNCCSVVIHEVSVCQRSFDLDERSATASSNFCEGAEVVSSCEVSLQGGPGDGDRAAPIFDVKAPAYELRIVTRDGAGLDR